MGAAQSNNVAEAVAEVQNSVNNSTVAGSTQVNRLTQRQDILNCNISVRDTATFSMLADLSVASEQILRASSDTSLTNNIQQQLLQSATSTVGSMGVGYASASNAASTFADATNTVINAVTATAGQFSQQSQNFTCDGSVIRATNLMVSSGSSTELTNSQTLQNDNVTNLVNDVTQTVTQTASATVEGLAGFILALAVLVLAFGYGVAKPLTTGPFKILIVVLIGLALAGIAIWMYLASAPPFFNEPNECGINSALGGCESECIDYAKRTQVLLQPPLKYMFALSPADSSSSGTAGANLVQMAISANAGSVGGGSGDNGGYRMDVHEAMQFRIDDLYSRLSAALGVGNLPRKIPNPLVNALAGGGTRTFYLIPDEYRTSLGQGEDNGSCTPRSLRVFGSTTSIRGCPAVVGAAYFGNSRRTTEPALGVANLANANWINYLRGDSSQGPHDTAERRVFLARFMLCHMLGSAALDLGIYVHDNEIVQYQLPDESRVRFSFAKDATEHTLRFIPHAISQFRNGVVGGGTVRGQFGICNDRTYKFHQLSRRYGTWILVALVVLVMGYVMLSGLFAKSGKAATETAANESSTTSSASDK